MTDLLSNCYKSFGPVNSGANAAMHLAMPVIVRDNTLPDLPSGTDPSATMQVTTTNAIKAYVYHVSITAANLAANLSKDIWSPEMHNLSTPYTFPLTQLYKNVHQDIIRAATLQQSAPVLGSFEQWTTFTHPQFTAIALTLRTSNGMLPAVIGQTGMPSLSYQSLFPASSIPLNIHASYQFYVAITAFGCSVPIATDAKL